MLQTIRERLRTLPFLHEVQPGLRVRTVMTLLAVGEEVRVKSGHVIFREGDVSDGQAYILLDGMLTVQKPETPPIEVHPPHLIGEIAEVAKRHQRTATVTAGSDVHLLGFKWAQFFEMAGNVCTPEECELLRTAIGQLAWTHLSE